MAGVSFIALMAKGSAALTTVTINSPDSAQALQTFTIIDRSAAVLSSVTIQKLGIYSLSARNVTLKIVKQNSTTNFDVVANQTFSHTGSGWEDFTLTSPYAVPASGTYNLAAYIGAGGSSPDIKVTSIGRSYSAVDMTGAGQAATDGATNQVFPLRYSY